MPKQVTDVTANGPSGSLSLNPGENKVVVEATTLDATTTVIVQTKTDGDSSQWSQNKDPEDSSTPAQLDAADSISGGGYSREFIIYGPGNIRAYAANFGASTGVKLRVVPSAPR